MGSTADKVKGATNEAIGKAKQGVGEAIGSDKLQGYAMPAMTNLDDGCLPLHVEQLDVEHQRRVRRNPFTSSNSTSNISVAFGGMAPPAPRAP